MSKIIAFCASLAFLVGVSGGAGAALVPSPLPGEPLDIDFRILGDFGGCDTLVVCGPIDGVTVVPFPTDTGGLFWAADDGFGVRGGEIDEIDPLESLTVTFDAPRLVTGAWFTDLFIDTAGAAAAEEAIVNLFLGLANVGTFNFLAEEFFALSTPCPPGGCNNGGLFGSFGGAISVDKLVFTALNITDVEYSVAAITVVPLPGALGLMVSGLAAFVVMARRRRKAAAA